MGRSSSHLSKLIRGSDSSRDCAFGGRRRVNKTVGFVELVDNGMVLNRREVMRNGNNVMDLVFDVAPKKCL